MALFWKASSFGFIQLQEVELREAELLVFADEQVLPNAMTVSDLTDKLGLWIGYLKTIKL